MKLKYLTFFISLSLLSSCASLDLHLPWDSDSSSEAEADPIAEAARQFREPAATTSLDPEDHIWNRRSTPPAATIRYGMPMSDVAAIWGEPAHIDAAGDSRDGNQRWTYFSGLSSRYGLGSKRTVYFEGGKVVGWRQ